MRRATFLAAASKLLAGPLEDVTPLDVIARMTVPWLCDWCNILLVDDDGEARSAAAYHHDQSKIELVRRAAPRPAPPPSERRARHRHRRARARQRHHRRAAQPAPGERRPVSIGTREQLEILRGLGMRARMIVPLRARGQIIGAIVFATRRCRSAHYDARRSEPGHGSGAARRLVHRQPAALPGSEAGGGACATSSSRSPRTSCARR